MGFAGVPRWVHMLILQKGEGTLTQMRQILVDKGRCLGCRSCEIACAVAHSASQTLFGAVTEAEVPISRVAVERVAGINFPLQCRHCIDALCVKACMTGALYRDPETGTVRQRAEACVGCWMCVMACPFGAVTQDPTRKVAIKCDRCLDREIPACVAACPTQALQFTEVPAFSHAQRQNYLVHFINNEEVR